MRGLTLHRVCVFLGTCAGGDAQADLVHIPRLWRHRPVQRVDADVVEVELDRVDAEQLQTLTDDALAALGLLVRVRPAEEQ